MEPQKFCWSGEAVRKEALHYTDCGLDNIFLQNGYEVENLDGDEYVTITDIDGLHKAIGLHIVLRKKAPTAREMRFLRTEMALSQVELGQKLGVSDQTIARWEKGHTDVPGTAVFAFKVLYVFSLIPDGKREKVMTDFLNALEKLPDDVTDDFVLSYSNEEWLDVAA